MELAAAAVLLLRVAAVSAGSGSGECVSCTAHTEYGWDYGLDSSGSHKKELFSKPAAQCGGEQGGSYEVDLAHGGEFPNARCGQDHWGDICANCAPGAASYPSPVDVDSSYLYTPHGIDELRFTIDNDGAGCRTADVDVTPRTWRITFAGSCERSIGMKFKYDEEHKIKYDQYYAHKIEFRYPSEHTIDGHASDMEAQFYFVKRYSSSSKSADKGPSGGDPTIKLVISVLMETNAQGVPAEDEFEDNPFLANIWTRALNSSSSSHSKGASSPSSSSTPWPPGTLNFVDNFLPSDGLHYSYYYYKGGLTTPPCVQCDNKKVKWVVMKAKAKMSTRQVTDYVYSITHVNHSLANSHNSSHHKSDNKGGGAVTAPDPIYQSTARQIQCQGDCHVYEFVDEHCYIRFCHKIFALGAYLHPEYAIICLAILIVVTILIEVSLHHLEHKLHKHRTAINMLSKVLAELAILGFVSFVVFAFKASCAVSIGGEDDVVQNHHYLAFEVAHILIFMVAMFYVMFNSTVLLMTDYFSTRLDKILNMKGDDLDRFIESQYDNPFKQLMQALLGRSKYTDYGFVLCSKEFVIRHELPERFDYLKYVRYCLSHSITESMDIGYLTWMFCFVFCFVTWYASQDNEGLYSFGGWLAVATLIIALAMSRVSFTRLIRSHIDDVSLEGVKTMLHQIEGDGKSRARIHNASKRSMDVKESHGDKLHEKEETAEALRAAWVPFGLIHPTYFLCESSAMVTCFYAGIFAIQYQNIIDSGTYLLVVIPIVLICGLLTPAIMLQKTMIESITHPNSELVGEVTEFMEDTKDMRKMLMDTLFPHLNDQLMEKINSDSIIKIFMHFDEDGSLSIEPAEFIAGCRALDLHLSPHQAKRLLRLLDEDRSGEIDPSEVHELLAKEKHDRVERRVDALLDKLSELESSGKVSTAKLDLLVSGTYGDSDVPEEFKTAVEVLRQVDGVFDGSEFVKIVEAELKRLNSQSEKQIQSAMDKVAAQSRMTRRPSQRMNVLSMAFGSSRKSQGMDAAAKNAKEARDAEAALEMADVAEDSDVTTTLEQ